MTRIYSRGSALGGLLEGLNEGRELKRQHELRTSAALTDASKFGESRYAKPKIDPNTGLPVGFEDDTESLRRDQPIIRSRLPGMFPVESTKPVTDYQGIPAKTKAPIPKEITLPNGDKVIDYIEPEGHSAPAMPAHLLGPSKAETPEPIEVPRAPEWSVDVKPTPTRTVKQEEGDPKPLGKDAAGNTVYVQPVRQGVAFDDVTVEGTPPKPQGPASPAPAPTAPATPPDFNPSRSYMTRLAEYTTGAGAKEVDRETAIGSLPEDLQRVVLGKGPNDPISPEEQRLTIRDSILKEVLQQRLKADKSVSQLNDATYDVVTMVENGLPFGTAMRILAQRQGEPPNPQQTQALRTAYGNFQQGVGRQFTKEFRDEQRSDKLEDKLDKAVERFQKAYKDTGVLDALPYLQQLERETGVVTGQNVDKRKLPGAATNLARSIPLVGNSAALAMAKSYKGGATAQALQGLLNMQIKNLSGAAVSSYEQGRNLIQAGMAPGGSEEDVARGIQLVMQGLKEADSSVRAAFDPSVVRTFESRGGQVPVLDKVMQEERRSRKSGPEGYEQELKSAQTRLSEYRTKIQKQMAEGGYGAAWGSRQVEEKKSKLNEYFQSRFKRPFREAE